MTKASLKILILTGFLCLLGIGLSAQTAIERQAISSGGNSFDMANESYKISATIGQPVAATMANDNYIVTAGFQQSGLSMVSVFTAQSADISVFPNPGTDFIMVKSDLKNYSLKLFDAKGSLAFSQQKITGNNVVEVAWLNPGEYIMQILSATGELLSVQKIIKN